MDIFNPSNLATGGIIAVVIGFWQQAKNLASYLSSFLIIQASFDSNTSRAIVSYLKKEYQVGVSGIFNYSSVYCKFPLLKKYVYVPFRKLNQINDEWTDNEQLKKSSRFYIEKIIGSEKGMWGDFNNRKSGVDGPGSSPTTSLGPGPDGLDQPNINLDKSFRYEPTEYRWTDECKP